MSEPQAVEPPRSVILLAFPMQCSPRICSAKKVADPFVHGSFHLALTTHASGVPNIQLHQWKISIANKKK
jgi:hypothetical protein